MFISVLCHSILQRTKLRNIR